MLFYGIIVALATAFPQDFDLLVGTSEYKDASLMRIEGREAVIMHSAGVIKIHLSLLSDEQKELLGIVKPLEDSSRNTYYTKGGTPLSGTFEKTSRGLKVTTETGIQVYEYLELAAETLELLQPLPPPPPPAPAPTYRPAADVQASSTPTYSSSPRSYTTGNSYTPKRRDRTTKIYYYGPRGGRYYYNSKGKKVYE